MRSQTISVAGFACTSRDMVRPINGANVFVGLEALSSLKELFIRE